MKAVLRFREMKKEEGTLAGGKGGTLARLFQAGYPVPDGFVIMPAAFQGDKLKKEAEEEIAKNLSQLGGRNGNAAFAVRSSALSEDSAGASFAGEFETVLGVRSAQQVCEAVFRVRRSKRSERVNEYSRAKGLDADHEMAVVVQKMLQPEFAGVLFTADPISGNRMQMVGNYVRGLGEQLVSGEANAKGFRMKAPGGEYEGPEEMRSAAVRLYRMARRLEAELGRPQDIEWAVEGGKLYLLQSRPITTLSAYNPETGEWNDSLSGDYLWSNVNLSEAVSDVMTPFTWSILQHEVEAAQVFEIPGNHPLIGNICGRPYFNFGLLVSFPVALGMKKQSILKQVEEIYGTVPEGLEIPILPIPAMKLLTGIVSGKLKLLWGRRNSKRELQDYLERNPSWCRELRERIRRIDRPEELASVWEAELKPRYSLSCVFLKLGMDKVESVIKLRNKLEKLAGREEANLLLSNFCGKAGHLASLGPVIGLSRVAAGTMPDAEYIELFGHRSEHEVELSLPRPAETSDWLARVLESYRQSGIDADTLLENQRKEAQAAWEKFAFRFPDRAKSIRSELDRVSDGARLRENIRSEYVRVFWVIREFALKAGELTGMQERVFFLSFPEALELLAGKRAPSDRLLQARRETYERYCALPPYPAIIRGRFDPFRWAADPGRRSDVFAPGMSAGKADTDAIKGFAGAQGVVAGKVRRLNSPDEIAVLEKGEILVTTTTNIGWTPLFPKAAAIVTDVGAPLSHAAIVARELGIPAVVGCCNATMRLRTGDLVEVDGGAGTVKILRAAAMSSDQHNGELI